MNSLNNICSHIAAKLLPVGTEVELVDYISDNLKKGMRTKITSWNNGSTLSNRKFLSFTTNDGTITEGWFHTRVRKIP